MCIQHRKLEQAFGLDTKSLICFWRSKRERDPLTMNMASGAYRAH